MRTIKELLQIMLDNKQCFCDGLCIWTRQLQVRELITDVESRILWTYIRDNRPSKYSSFEAFSRRDSAYYWVSGNIEPRIKWIQKHISKR